MIGFWEVAILLAVVLAFSIPALIALVALIRSKLDNSRKNKRR